MALSERERRILEEIEDALERDDPKLARRVSGVASGAGRLRRLLLSGWFMVAVIVVTVALLVLAVALA
ncbi:DUF3040 domain-containing protein [Nonomuraea sp. NPDC050478]|uniref:DUF3040 domain-containing protein n=1 Tax=Nonomuraea sp. NPDC050478 TaxID=3364365 RepID=UPI0037A31547